MARRPLSWTSPNVWGRDITLADVLSGEARNPSNGSVFAPATSLINGIAGGMYGLSGRQAAGDNETLTSEAYRKAAGAGSNEAAGQALAGSGVPDLAKEGLGVLLDDRQQKASAARQQQATAAEQAWRQQQADQERWWREQQLGLDSRRLDLQESELGLKGTSPVKLTEQQTKDAGFANRMARANGILGQLEGAADPAGFANMALSPDSLLHSDTYRSYMQGKREWIAAMLRKDSGAQINESEFALADSAYFPQPGDGPATIANKARARQEIADGMRRGAGAAYETMFPEGQQPAAEPQAQQQPPQTLGQIPTDTPRRAIRNRVTVLGVPLEMVDTSHFDFDKLEPGIKRQFLQRLAQGVQADGSIDPTTEQAFDARFGPGAARAAVGQLLQAPGVRVGR